MNSAQSAAEVLIFQSVNPLEKPGYYIVEASSTLDSDAVGRLSDLLQAKQVETAVIDAKVVGPRKEIVSPWSTNATEIARNVGLGGVTRIEQFFEFNPEQGDSFDPMVQSVYPGLSHDSLKVEGTPEPSFPVNDIARFNKEAGLALSTEELSYLQKTSEELGRPLTDSELYGFAQVNSEHCRHKIFNGRFVIDGESKEQSLFSFIKSTSSASPRNLVSAYKDNVAFLSGPSFLQFAPAEPEKPGIFSLTSIESVLSVKAETHNFPTTVEPFSGASTGSGGEIRDRMAGGRGSVPLAGTAVYMTAYPRLMGNKAAPWETYLWPRTWLYQSPADILIKASNGASDFGNKFGQPLINGSLLTYEMPTSRATYGFDRCIMLAGGVGYANRNDAEKQEAKPGDKIVLLGGDNYRIGMAGGSVSSVGSGEYAKHLELNAVQRANAEMQKRVYNVIRALLELPENPIKLIHDHGAGGHVNCLSELVDPQGGVIYLEKLPVGDKTLSAREIICNESQERMGLVVAPEAVPLLEKIAARERAPMYVVGEITGSRRITFQGAGGEKPVDLPLEVLFGSSPVTVMEDIPVPLDARPIGFKPADGKEISDALDSVLSLEGVACKDWLTNKVDRSVTGKVAQQQCVGPLQLPLSNLGVAALDYSSGRGIATALGHAPGVGIIDEKAGSALSLAEALTNLIWAPLKDGLKTISLSANWMWPCRRPGEDARLYSAVEALSAGAKALGIPVPTGKDSLSMTMRYEDGAEVRAPGTVIITAVGEVEDIRGCVTPVLKPEVESALLYADLSGQSENHLGGSSLSQVLGQIGNKAPAVTDWALFKRGLEALQELVKGGLLLAGHDISCGGLLTAACEMAFAGNCGLELALAVDESPALLFCEKPSVLLQVSAENKAKVNEILSKAGLAAKEIGHPLAKPQLVFSLGKYAFTRSLNELRRAWYRPSFLLDSKQTEPEKAKERFEHFDKKRLNFTLPKGFSGKAADLGVDLERKGAGDVKAAIIREKGTNGDREMAFALHAAGFEVRDVTMSDLMSGAETLEDLNFVVFPGGFSNSDVLGAGRGWAAAFRYNERALGAIRSFMERENTLSLGVCNGCQLMAALGLLYPQHERRLGMRSNASKKFESAFIAVEAKESESVLLKKLKGTRLGIWVAHGEGRFFLPEGEENYDIPLRYVSSAYPANPNGSDFDAAAVCSKDGRHLAMMPHLERSVLPWQWGFYPEQYRRAHEITPWMMAFASAREWIRGR